MKLFIRFRNVEKAKEKFIDPKKFFFSGGGRGGGGGLKNILPLRIVQPNEKNRSMMMMRKGNDYFVLLFLMVFSFHLTAK